MKLYEIDEKDVIEIIKNCVSDIGLVPEKKEIVYKEFLEKYRYPLKVVFSQESDKIIVITVYPVKKERKK